MKRFFDRLNLLLDPAFVTSLVLLVVFFLPLRPPLEKGRKAALRAEAGGAGAGGERG